jgi:two-component system sensor histidine kinase VicK
MKSLSLKFLYKLFFDNTLDGLAYCQMIFDAEKRPVDFVCLAINKNFRQLTGLSGIVGKRITKVIPEISLSNPEIFECFGRVSVNGKPEKFEVYIKPLDKWFFVSVYSPKKQFFIAVFQNITDRKEIEINLENAKIAAHNVLEDLQVEKESLARAKAKDEAILESLGEGLIAVDNDKKIMVINKVALSMLGWEMSDLIGKVITDLPLVDDTDNPVSLNKRPTTVALNTGKITKVTYFFVRKNKTKFPIAITATPIKLKGKTLGLIEILRDVTVEREIDKAKSEFVSLASHQLRTPLTTVSWYTEMILNGDVGVVTPSQKKYLEEIYQGNQRMIELVNTLLDVSRIELGTFKIDPKSTDIIALAESVLFEQKQKIETKKLILVKKFDKKITLFQTDPKLLRMVFQNILNNAIEYTGEGGKIEFSISFDDKKALFIKISDTGYGIPKNQQNQIFTKLFRADNVRDKGINGTGLGLYIVKSVVESSGGKIWFSSEENKGTTFYIIIPFKPFRNKESKK